MKSIREQMVLLVMVTCLWWAWGPSGVGLFGQEGKNAAPAPAQAVGQQKPVVAPLVPLTDEESKDVEINALKMQMLDMQIRDAETKMWQARQQIQKDLDDLTNRLAKAHSVDLSAYRLDSQAKAFVPKATPAAGPKPATADGKQKTGDGKRETGNGEN